MTLFKKTLFSKNEDFACSKGFLKNVENIFLKTSQNLPKEKGVFPNFPFKKKKKKVK